MENEDLRTVRVYTKKYNSKDSDGNTVEKESKQKQVSLKKEDQFVDGLRRKGDQPAAPQNRGGLPQDGGIGVPGIDRDAKGIHAPPPSRNRSWKRSRNSGKVPDSMASRAPSARRRV